MLADRIRKVIGSKIMEYNGAKVLITMTFGVTVSESHETISDMIRKADRALYEGENRGRNCVLIG